MSRSLALLLLSTVPTVAGAQPLPDPIYPIRDDYGLLEPAAVERVREEIEALEAETSAEIGILILATTSGADHHDFGLRVFNHWGVGKAERNNGVLLLFAMDDRRVELIPGQAYEELFDRRRSEDLLQAVVVPKMRAGQPRQAVLDMVREVAREIRIHEGIEAPAAAGVAEDPGLQTYSEGERVSPARAVTDARRRGRTRLVATGAGVTVLVLWAAASAGLLFAALAKGKLLLSRGMLFFVLVGGGVLAAGLAIYLAVINRREELLGVGAASGVATMIFGGVARHLCPTCNRWMRIEREVLRPASYTSSGTGVRTRDCRHCGLHDTTSFHIPMRTRSSSSSSGSSWSSSSSSFGGGSSRGGGGGASW